VKKQLSAARKIAVPDGSPESGAPAMISTSGPS
jgi:hypothetical protein